MSIGLAKTRLRERASGAVRFAIGAGLLVRPAECSLCGARCVVHGHHEDYSRRLSVVWLCCRCHQGRHAEMRAAGIDPYVAVDAEVAELAERLARPRPKWAPWLRRPAHKGVGCKNASDS